MKKVFWENPYQKSLNTTVEFVNEEEVLFKETIAYSFAGGQESDKAWVNGTPVLNSRMKGTLIYYTLPDHHGLKAGDPVLMEIDWPRRYRLMRLHFAAELLLEIITQKYHLEKVGAHIAEHKARIDFLYPENISSLFEEILCTYTRIIQKDEMIKTDFSDRETQRRFWKIDGFAQVPCGGTHVKSSKEVGLISLKRSHPGKGVERIEIRLLEDFIPA